MGATKTQTITYIVITDFKDKETMRVKIKRLHPDAVIPKKAHTTDAGFDLVATSRVFAADGTATYGTGLAVDIPQGYVGLLFPRSSIYKQDQMQTNSVGVIDAGYHGEVMVKMKPTLIYIDNPGIIPNQATRPDQHDGTDQTDASTQMVTFHGRSEDYPDVPDGHLPFPFRAYEVGERIAQLVIIPYPDILFEETDEFPASERDKGGFGSSGK